MNGPGWVKICGIRSLQDADQAVSTGADAIGLNLWAKSPRALDLGDAVRIATAVRGRVSIVAVVVDMGEAELERVVRALGPDLVQMHGDEGQATVAAWQPRAVKAVGLREEADVKRALSMPGAWVLLDARDEKKRGGTGTRVDPALALRVVKKRRVVLAGGLDPDNVAEAIAAVGPWGVDVASGVEVRPGEKDPARLEAFVRNARAAFLKRG